MQSPLKGLGSGETSEEEEEEEEEGEEEQDEEQEEDELPLREQSGADAGGGMAQASASTSATPEDAADAALLIAFRSEESNLSKVSTEAPRAVRTEPAAGGVQAAIERPGDDEDDDDEAGSLAKQNEEVDGVAGDDAAWQVIPGGFSVKKCLHGQKHDAQTIQRWMGVRRPSKGIEVLVRDRLTHHAIGASSALVCSLVTVHDQPPVILCVAREQKHSRVFVADLETGAIASGAETINPVELGAAFSTLAETGLVDDGNAASQDPENFAIKRRGDPRQLFEKVDGAWKYRRAAHRMGG